MCNWAVFTGKPKDRGVLDKSLQTLAGTVNHDATGVALFTEKAPPIVFKAGVKAEVFIKLEGWHKAYKNAEKHGVVGAMLHARNATDGLATNPFNNHPHSSVAGSLLIHKGIVDVVHKFQNARGDCDSEQILLSLDKHGLVDGLGNIRGTADIAYFAHWEKKPQIYLYGDAALKTWEADGLRWVSTSHALAPMKCDSLVREKWHMLEFNNTITTDTQEVKLLPRTINSSFDDTWVERYNKASRVVNCPVCSRVLEAAIEFDIEQCLNCFMDAYDKFKHYMGFAALE